MARRGDDNRDGGGEMNGRPPSGDGAPWEGAAPDSQSVGEAATYVHGVPDGAVEGGTYGLRAGDSREIWQTLGGYLAAEGETPYETAGDRRRAEEAARGPRPLRDLVLGVLGRQGALAAMSGGDAEDVGAGGGFRFEPRPQQETMAAAIADTLEAGGSILIEAGTGVGKSLAYLVPLLLHALQTGAKVLVSTYTIALQEQLMRKDLPLLRESLGLAFRPVLVKGRSNYLCRRRLQRTRKGQQELFASPEQQELARIADWADSAREGSLQELTPAPRPSVWSSVCAERGNCLGRKCPFHGSCFFQRARARIHEADLLVVNHHLLFSDMAIRMDGPGFLPPVDAVVLDEAHTVEDAASDHLGLHVSHSAFEYWMRRLFVPDTGKGLLAQLREGEAAHLVTRLWQAVPGLFRDIETAANFKPEEPQRTLSEPLGVESPVPQLLADLAASLNVLARKYEELEESETAAELRSLKESAEGAEGELRSFLDQSCHDHVYWLEREGRRRSTVLHSAPIEVAPTLRTELFEQYPAVVLTSATLAVSGRLDYARQRLGAPDDARMLCLGSPFDYRRNVRLLAAAGGPEPSDPAAYAAAVAHGILRFAEPSQGRTFALFTSFDLLRRTAGLLEIPFEDAGLVPLLQNGATPRSRLLATFRQADRPYVLFGLDSFWMGVDVRGDALSTVIITRLPFAVPDQPVVAARMRRIEQNGGNSFRDYSLPEAILKFRQGFGRLIRSATDTGTVVILDPRFLSKWYGRLFRASLPDCEIETFEPGTLGTPSAAPAPPTTEAPRPPAKRGKRKGGPA